MKKLLPLFLLIFFLHGFQIFCQTIVKAPYYKMVSWNSSPYKSFKVTGGSANPYYDMTFRLLWPKNYDSSTVSTTKYPLILMLHGAGESALGNYKWGFYPEGDPRRFNNDHHLLHLGEGFLYAVNHDKWPGFVLFPQSPDGYWTGQDWVLADAIEILTTLMKTLKIDPNRIVICGLSSGANGVWSALSRYTTLFAAATPFSGIGLPTYENTTKVAHLPIWYFQGEIDTSPAKYTADQTIQALRNVGGTPTYTVYAGIGHGTWNKASMEPDFYPFLKRYSKLSIHAYFGKTEFNSGETIKVRLGISPGFSGYEWRKDNVLISGATGSEITASSVGSYTVRFKRGTVWTEWSPPLVIKYKTGTNLPPSIVTQPVNKTVSVGSTVSFTISASGTAPLNYQWQKNGVNISGATSTTYTITNVQTSHAGTYRAVVTNTYGSAISNGAQLTVNSIAPPAIVSQPSSITVAPGATATFSVTASGTSPLSYQWQKNGTNISGATSSSYTINNVQTSNAGAYRAIVSNAYGSATSNSAQLSVTSSQAGLNYSYYEGNWTLLPNFNALTPVKTGVVSSINLSPRNREDLFGFKFTGYLNVPVTAQYTLYLQSDDGAKLYLDNSLIIDNDGNHAAWERSVVKSLSQGYHAIEVIYFERQYDQVLKVSWARSGVSKQEIPSSAYSTQNSGARISNQLEISAVDKPEIRLYPNPSIDFVGIDLIAEKGEKVTISIINSTGSILKSEGKIVEESGLNHLIINVNDMINNAYILKIQKGNKVYFKRLMINK